MRTRLVKEGKLLEIAHWILLGRCSVDVLVSFLQILALAFALWVAPPEKHRAVSIVSWVVALVLGENFEQKRLRGTIGPNCKFNILKTLCTPVSMLGGKQKVARHNIAIGARYRGGYA